MKFKVGDAVEIVKAFHQVNSQYVGMEAVVTATGCEFFGEFTGHRADGIRISRFSGGRLLVPEQLRLKRPPAWDKWLYDTSDVKDEKRIGMPA